MKGLYERAGISTSSMNSRISTLSGSLTLEEQNAIELAAVEQIQQVIETLDISKTHLANALGMPPPPRGQAKRVGPVGYLEATADIRPVYLRQDKLRFREAKTGTGDPMYWSPEQVAEAIVKNPKFEATERGKDLFSQQEL